MKIFSVFHKLEIAGYRVGTRKVIQSSSRQRELHKQGQLGENIGRTVIHKTPPVASWDSKSVHPSYAISLFGSYRIICTLQNLTGSSHLGILYLLFF